MRQVLAWREYIWWQYGRLGERLQDLNHFDARRPLPQWFWTGDTRVRCMRIVIERALRTGYTHHIERLMIACSFSVLAGLAPVDVNRWFTSLFVDAYAWVMVPNVFDGLARRRGTRPLHPRAGPCHRRAGGSPAVEPRSALTPSTEREEGGFHRPLAIALDDQVRRPVAARAPVDLAGRAPARPACYATRAWR